jgi:spore coat protein U-like protein
MLSKKWNARLLTAAGTTVLAFGVGSVQAATATANLPVTASVTANCTISTASAVAFGAYDPVVTNATSGSPLVATGTINVSCTSGASTTVTLSEGTNHDTGTSTAAAPVRRMNDGGTNYLSYQLYSEGTRTTVWGDTAPTGLAYSGIGSQESLTVYGRVPGAQNVPSGSYSDTVVATITF